MNVPDQINSLHAPETRKWLVASGRVIGALALAFTLSSCSDGRAKVEGALADVGDFITDQCSQRDWCSEVPAEKRVSVPEPLVSSAPFVDTSIDPNNPDPTVRVTGVANFLLPRNDDGSSAVIKNENGDYDVLADVVWVTDKLSSWAVMGEPGAKVHVTNPRGMNMDTFFNYMATYPYPEVPVACQGDYGRMGEAAQENAEGELLGSQITVEEFRAANTDYKTPEEAAGNGRPDVILSTRVLQADGTMVRKLISCGPVVAPAGT